MWELNFYKFNNWMFCLTCRHFRITWNLFLLFELPIFPMFFQQLLFFYPFEAFSGVFSSPEEENLVMASAFWFRSRNPTIDTHQSRLLSPGIKHSVVRVHHCVYVCVCVCRQIWITHACTLTHTLYSLIYFFLLPYVTSTSCLLVATQKNIHG